MKKFIKKLVLKEEGGDPIIFTISFNKETRKKMEDVVGYPISLSTILEEIEGKEIKKEIKKEIIFSLEEIFFAHKYLFGYLSFEKDEEDLDEEDYKNGIIDGLKESDIIFYVD